MTDERTKLSLKKPDQAASPDAADAADGPRRKPPVRGSGTAPRKRMTAAEAAQAREEASAREQQRQAAEHAEPARRERDAPRSDAPRHDPRDRYERPAQRDQSPRHEQAQRRDPRNDPRGDQRSDQRGSQHGNQRHEPHGGAHGQQRRDPRGDPRQDRHGGPSTPNRQTQPPHRDDGPRGPSSRHQPGRSDLRSEPRRDERGPLSRTGRPTSIPGGHAHAPTSTTPPREDDGRIRLSKLMSEKGLASRREADEWIDQGWVLVDGEVVSELGSRVFPDQVVTIDPAARSQQAQRVTILINKPIGYVSGQAEDGYEPAVLLVTPENRWSEDRQPLQLTRGHLRNLAPAGRLDIDSTGMLVLTQDGRVAKELIGEDSGVEKEYLVRVEHIDHPDAENVSAVLPPEALEHLRFGLELDGRQLKPAQVSWQNEQQLRFVLREGRKRQIRRMCELVGLKVTGLKRVRMGRITLGKLPSGQWRFLRPDERF
jgi:23S rRNA pseudouridine2604 synthase